MVGMAEVAVGDVVAVFGEAPSRCKHFGKLYCSRSNFSDFPRVCALIVKSIHIHGPIAIPTVSISYTFY